MSNHPIEQKTAAYRFHITRKQSLPLDQNKKQKEWQTIHSIARNNNFPQHLLQKLNRQIHNKTDHTRNRNTDNKRTWATFTYHSPQIRKSTKLFRNTKIGIAFKATATYKTHNTKLEIGLRKKCHIQDYIQDLPQIIRGTN